MSMKLGSVLIVAILSMPILSFAANSFHYDSATGKCLNAAVQEGLNHPDLSGVFKYDQGSSSPSDLRSISNKDLECADLSSINFRNTLHSDASYVELVNWNLKGARLSQSDVKWMVFVGGSVEGVDFTKGTLGYTMFRSVQIDPFTRGLSDFCVSTAEQGLIHCQM